MKIAVFGLLSAETWSAQLGFFWGRSWLRSFSRERGRKLDNCSILRLLRFLELNWNYVFLWKRRLNNIKSIIVVIKWKKKIWTKTCQKGNESKCKPFQIIIISGDKQSLIFKKPKTEIHWKWKLESSLQSKDINFLNILLRFGLQTLNDCLFRDY